jgi:hypothetical protein
MRREISLDAWRGLMLVVMAVNHIGGPMGAWVRQLFGYVSAAEGFVFLSGIMCGLVYTRYSSTGLRPMFERLWRRAWTIYRYHVGVLVILLVFVTGLSIIEPRLAAHYAKSDLAGFLDHPAASLIGSLLCLYLPSLIGILGLYVAYVASAPFILTLFIRGRAPLAFAISGALWLFAQVGGSTAIARLLPGHAYLELGTFDVFGWQILFVAGCYVGWRRCNGLDVLPYMNKGLLLAALAVAVPILLLRHWAPLAAGEFWGATDLLRLGWLRVIDTAAVAIIIYGAARLYAIELRSPWLALLGRHSLQVFCFHSLVIYAGWSVLWRRHFLGEFSDLADAAAVALFVASLSLPALLCERRRTARSVLPNPLIAPKLDMTVARRYM